MIKQLLTRSYSGQYFRKMSISLDLKQVIEGFENFAPLKYAEPWDNVGLLIEPLKRREVSTIFLTNDLTETVLNEAIDKNSHLIVSYHPPIFAPLKRITQASWKERIVAMCLENSIALYSPHTAWDVAQNGVNDWLASSLPYASIEPIKPIPDFNGGIGRKICLDSPITLFQAVDAIKKKTKLKHLHVAKSLSSKNISTVAICAGSGSSVLKNVEADLYLTGEMSHHEILDATQNDISVILCNHSNSERGFLDEFVKIIKNTIHKDLNVIISTNDVDPLETF